MPDGAKLYAAPQPLPGEMISDGDFDADAKLLALADRIDHEQNWQRSGIFQRDGLTQDQQDRVEAGVMLRRYADLMAPGGWSLFPPKPGLSFRASTLAKVVEMARQHEPSAAAQAALIEPEKPFQSRVEPWLLACFGEQIAADTSERNHRFLEEALELVQACGCSRGEAHQLVDYVFGRPVGEKLQEAGGVMVTLAALCRAQGLDMHQAGEAELARIWTKVEAIRAKQAAKPKHSPLPVALDPAGEPKLPPTVLELYAVKVLNTVKASPVFDQLPVELRMGVTAVLMLAATRRTGFAE